MGGCTCGRPLLVLHLEGGIELVCALKCSVGVVLEGGSVLGPHLT